MSYSNDSVQPEFTGLKRRQVHDTSLEHDPEAFRAKDGALIFGMSTLIVCL